MAYRIVAGLLEDDDHPRCAGRLYGCDDYPMSFHDYEDLRKRKIKKAMKHLAYGAAGGVLAGGLAGGKLGWMAREKFGKK